MLAQLQADFLNSILKNQPLTMTNNPVNVKNPDINIYQEIIFSRLQKNFSNVFPIVKKVVNEELFPHMIHHFITQYPSSSKNIFEYGDLFYDFIYFNHFEKNFLFLPDLARLEWAWYCVYHGNLNSKDNKQNLFNYIEKKQENSILKLPLSSKLLRLNYSTYSFWLSLHNNLDENFLNLIKSIEHEQQHLLIWQKEDKIIIERLNKSEYLLLKIIDKGLTLEEICFHYQTFSNENLPNDIFVSLCQRGCIRPGE